MKPLARLLFCLFTVALAASPPLPEDALERGFHDPPRQARLRAYWWWLNGNVTKAAISRDLEEMADKGFGGALICDAGGAEQDGNDRPQTLSRSRTVRSRRGARSRRQPRCLGGFSEFT